MLVKFTVSGGCEPINAQARGDVLSAGLQLLRVRNATAETAMRRSIREHMDGNTSFTAKQIASTGNGEEWKPEFETLFDAFLTEYSDYDVAFAEAGKCLGLLVWSEALQHPEEWHFTQYPKADADFFVTHYFAVEGHIKYKAKLAQAGSARTHGDETRARSLEEAADQLKRKWKP